jgi:phospholipase C
MRQPRRYPAAGAFNDRCGFGVREPFLVISPFAKPNYVDHSLNDITSILRFIEYNWNLGNIGDPQSSRAVCAAAGSGYFSESFFSGSGRTIR